MATGVVPLVLTSAAAIGLAIGLAPSLDVRSVLPGYEATVSGCRVTDGDTIRCGDERIRLLGIDAPELPGHCRQGRRCAPGDPVASTTSLRQAMTGSLRIARFGTDHYGRTLAAVAGDDGDLSCWQLEHRQAIYRGDWDNNVRIARTCPRALLR